MGESLKIDRPCPICHSENTITVSGPRIWCTKSECTFDEHYQCPICNHHLSPEFFSKDQRGELFDCPDCKSRIHLQKIKNIIENGLKVDFQNRCSICNGPSLHREDMNLSARCFFYPSCSGQEDLFLQQKKSYTFLDFETTGLEVGRNEIIEIGALKIDEDGYEYPYQKLIKPSEPIHATITQITGITNDMVENAPTIEAVFPEFIEFIGNSTIVAHNANFDIPWLITTAMRLNIPMQFNTILCTLKWAKASQEPRCSLGALTKKYGIRHENAHRALADAAATKELFFIFENAKKATPPTLVFEEYVSLAEKINKKFGLVPA